MENANIIVEHTWTDENSEKVFKVVSDIVGMQNSGSLPNGFRLKSVNVVKGENKAICNWESPGISELQGLLEQVNPPTSHKVYQADCIL